MYVQWVYQNFSEQNNIDFWMSYTRMSKHLTSGLQIRHPGLTHSKKKIFYFWKKIWHPLIKYYQLHPHTLAYHSPVSH